jgi:hypothetical protein
MTIASSLSGMISVKHPTLGILCREDGAVLMRCRSANKTNKYHYTFGFRKNNGYRQVQIAKKQYFVHRLIAEAFLNAIPEKTLVDHINRVRDDNRVENLRWVTSKENNDNSSNVLNRNEKIPVRCCEDKKAYIKFKNSLCLYMQKPDGGQTTSGILPKDVYDQLKLLSQRDRFTAYHAWKQNRSKLSQA